jgi:hypothetical protein
VLTRGGVGGAQRNTGNGNNAPQPGGGGGGALLTPVQVDQEETSGQGVIRIHLHFAIVNQACTRVDP